MTQPHVSAEPQAEAPLKYRTWHIPNIPGPAFQVDTDDPFAAFVLLNALADYDAFRLEQGYGPDYSNVQGLMIWDPHEQDYTDISDEEDIDAFARALNERGVPVEAVYDLLGIH